MSVFEEHREALAAQAVAIGVAAEIRRRKSLAEIKNDERQRTWRNSRRMRFAGWLRRLADRIEPPKPEFVTWRDM